MSVRKAKCFKKSTHFVALLPVVQCLLKRTFTGIGESLLILKNFRKISSTQPFDATVEKQVDIGKLQLPVQLKLAALTAQAVSSSMNVTTTCWTNYSVFSISNPLSPDFPPFIAGALSVTIAEHVLYSPILLTAFFTVSLRCPFLSQFHLVHIFPTFLLWQKTLRG